MLRAHFAPLLFLIACAPRAAAQEFAPWLVLGPFDHPGGSATIAVAHPVERELESMKPGAAGPQLDVEHRGEGNLALRWKPLPGAAATSTALDVGRINFLGVLQPAVDVEGWRERSVAYLYRRITCAEDTRLPVQMGSDDGLRLWLNGELLIDKPVARGLNPGDEALDLELRAGDNHLLIKVVQDGGAWDFQMLPWKRVTQAAIERAIDRGVDFLLDNQLIDGSWAGFADFGNGHSAYCVYTLLKCGLPPEHPAVQRGLAWVRARPTGYTYSLACELLALCALGESADAAWRQRVLRDLIGIQESSGLYAYPVHPHGTAIDDLSNTLFAALALRAAAEVGLAVPERTWRRLIDGSFRCIDTEAERGLRKDRDAAGGFRYRPDWGTTGAMTTAGLSVLAIADTALGGKHSKDVRARLDTARTLSLRWLERNMGWSTNPGANAHQYFFIYGMERVGVLLGLTILGGVDWYWSGADYLVRNQKESGAWVHEDQCVETILALLFLKRATMPSSGRRTQARSRHYASEDPQAQVALHASGDTPLSMWVERIQPELVQELEWPGEAGRGPRIAKVEFLARSAEQGAAWTVVAVDPGQPDRPAGARRFAAQHRFEANGEYLVKARVAVVGPATESSAPAERMLESPELRVRMDGVLAERALAYGTDRERDLLADAVGRVTASSHAGGGDEPEKCADGWMGTRWRSAANDAQPWVEIDLRRMVRASRILLTHPDPRPGTSAKARAASVEVLINDRERHLLTMDPDVSVKSVLEFEKPQRIRKLRLTILSAVDRALGADPIGFAEVELQ